MDKSIKYLDTRRVVEEGEAVITTKNPADRFYRECAFVDKTKYGLAGVVVTGDRKLCAMDTTKIQDLETFVNGVGKIIFVKPAGGIIYKLPKDRIIRLKKSYEEASVEMSTKEIRALLIQANMRLGGGIIASMNFAPRGELSPSTR